MNILKIEPFSGLSGDMFLGALAELTNGWDDLLKLPQKLNLENIEIKITNVVKSGISCNNIMVIDHNEYKDNKSFGSLNKPTDSKNLNLDQLQFSNQHKNNHKNEHHHRNLYDIYKIIDDAELPESVKQISKKIFLLLGEAEAKVHGIDLDKIHFHEVGAVDSIIDIIGSSLLIDKLKITKVYSKDICTGFGFATTQHGRLPIPCPATKELLLGFPTYSGNNSGELTTPTGAAILKFLNPNFNIPTLVEIKTGHGPGEKELEQPNVLRLTLCDEKNHEKENVFILETNIDDSSSEFLGSDFQTRLLEIGALDFFISQIIMKKGRPGLLISILCDQNNLDIISDFVLENTTSIGLRYYPVKRNILKRSLNIIETSLGIINVKEVVLPSGKIRIVPEYESCHKISKEQSLPLTEVFSTVNSEIRLKSKSI